MSLAHDIAYALGGAKKTPDGYVCKCPCHDDRSASLSLADTPTGKLAVNCFAGCQWEIIRDELMRRDLIPKPSTNGNHSNGYDKYAGAKFYYYKDLNGKTLCRKVKLPDKKMWFERLENGTYVNGLAGMQIPLYNILAVMSAPAETCIYLCEGEKDAETLIAAGFIATTNHAGANSWADHLTESLRGKSIIIIPDNDDAGRKRTEMLKRLLSPVVSDLRLFIPDNVPEKGDITDWVNAGGDLSQVALKATVLKEKQKEIEALDAGEWLATDAPPQDPLLVDVFDTGDKVVIIGQSKTRKSFFAQQLAFTIATAQSFLGFPALERRKVLIIQFEIKPDRYKARCRRMMKHLKIDSKDLSNWLKIVNARGETDLQQIIERQVLKHKPAVVIIDPFYKIVSGDENKSEDIKPVLRFFDSLSEKTGVTVIYIHHDKKGVAGDQQLTDRGAGSGLLSRDFDSAIFLSPHKDRENTLVIEFITRNYAPQPIITVDWADHHFNRSDALPEKKTARNAAKGSKIKLSALIDAAQKMVGKLYLDGPKEMGVGMFNSMLEDVGISERRTTAVKEELVRDGYIEIETDRAKKGSSSKTVRILRGMSQMLSEAHEYNDLPF